MELHNRAEPVALSVTKRKRNHEKLTWQGRRHLPSRNVLPSESVTQDKVSSKLWMSRLCPKQSYVIRWTAAQVGNQSKAWDKSGTFTKTHITSSSDLELTNRISPPVIPHVFQRLIRDSEQVNWKLTKIISVENHIRSEDRQCQIRPYLIGRAYIY